MIAMFHPVLMTAALFAAMVVAMAAGRWLGRRRVSRLGKTAIGGSAAVEGAVLALLGLLVAFTFSNAANRFDNRRSLLVDHANAVSSAWNLVDVLPEDHQPALREQFREFVRYLLLAADESIGLAEQADAVEDALRTQSQMWSAAVAAVGEADRQHVNAGRILPALNTVGDLSTSRIAAAQVTVPMPIMATVYFFACLASFMAGHGSAASEHWNWFLAVVFSCTICTAIYTILDLESPRAGLIRLDATDFVLSQVQDRMAERP